MNEIFQRTELLVGSEEMGRLRELRVIVFGVGGVGSWCVEALVRSGVGHLTIVDRDVVAASNINRQLMATTETIGRSKVEVMRKRLYAINPDLDLTAIHNVYTAETQGDYPLNDYDIVIDAIDSIDDKVLLIENACKSRARLLSSMGAALKSDPTRIRVAEFWKVTGCPLARALRNKFKKSGRRPERKFQCVYSDELLQNKGADNGERANGTLMHATAMFGLMLAWLAIKND